MSELDDRLLRHGPAAFERAVAQLDPSRPPPVDVPELHAGLRVALERCLTVVGEERRAVMLLVKGDPGQGKTHALAWLRRHAAGKSADVVDIPPLKQTSGIFALLLRHVVWTLRQNGRLQTFLWQALEAATRRQRQHAIDTGDHETAESLSEVLPDAPGYPRTFRILLHNSPVAHLVEGARRFAPLDGIDADVARVLCRLAQPTAEPLVVEWLGGAELGDDDLARLASRRALADEERCFAALAALVRLSPRPLALCFDQLESIAGLLGEGALVALMTALMELYQQLPVGLVLMCQTSVWGQLRMSLPQAALERLDELPPLSLPTADDAQRLLAARLRPLFCDVTPPYETYPFSQAWLAGYCADVRPTLRRILVDCGERLTEMQLAGRIFEPVWPETAQPHTSPPAWPEVATAPTPPVDAAPATARETPAVPGLFRAFSSLRKEAQTSITIPGERHDRLRSAISQLLDGLSQGRGPKGRFAVLEVDTPAKPRNGPRPPSVATLHDGETGVRRRLAFDAHCDVASGVHHVLERLRIRVADGEAEVAVLFREARLPIGEQAHRCHEILATLEPQGGIAYLEEDLVERLLAADLLLDAVAGRELMGASGAIERGDALAFLLHDGELAAALEPIFARVLRPALRKRGRSKPRASA